MTQTGTSTDGMLLSGPLCDTLFVYLRGGGFRFSRLQPTQRSQLCVCETIYIHFGTQIEMDRGIPSFVRPSARPSLCLSVFRPVCADKSRLVIERGKRERTHASVVQNQRRIGERSVNILISSVQAPSTISRLTEFRTESVSSRTERERCMRHHTRRETRESLTDQRICEKRR